MNYLKFGKNFLAAILALSIFVGCSEDEEQAPVYDVGFNLSVDSPVAGQAITFENISQGGSAFVWTISQNDQEIHTSNEKNLSYTFKYPGMYNVSVVPDGWDVKLIAKNVTIGEALPEIFMDVEEVVAQEGVELSATVYDPDAKGVKSYNWEFVTAQSGAAIVATGDDVENNASSVAAPVVKFANDGIVTVRLTVTMNDTALSTAGDGVLVYEYEVDVKAELAPTLYIAQKEGTLHTARMLAAGPELADTSIPLGVHPLTVRYKGDRVYIFDAGSLLTYVNPETTATQEVPGSITSVDAEGNVTIHAKFLTTATSASAHYKDAFTGDVDVENGKIYFADRRDGVYAIPLNDQTLELDPAVNMADYQFVKNAELGYYSSYGLVDGYGYGWGALNGDFQVMEGGEFWWSKASNHRGLWKFEEGDIVPGANGDNPPTSVPAAGALLRDHTVKAFAVDKANQKIYFSANKVDGVGVGVLYRANLDGSNVEVIDDAPFQIEGGDNENVGITGIAVDAHTGYVYWAYRAAAEDEENVSGIKRFKLDGTTDKDEVEMYIEGVEAYGLALDSNLK
ncbi:hypothetical protein [Sediminitomix flava]|uniref:PKD domain-containing protein n=1 Tax=Sediminitomix flava TaxID=379075 RepID=A0A315ZE49_SEDFL|nr:hypothetical protein [Sediminitomix flava]PWJ43845.1 hypothetical protein BC781_101191 [Sediminitomix flava]